MFCHQCGAKAHGNFCTACGTRLGAPEREPEPLLQDWSDEIRYEVLLRQPEVRDLIARHAAQSKKRVSGEEFLELCDKAFIPIIGVSVAKIGAIALPLYARLGIKTGKTLQDRFEAPAGKLLVAALCSMARNGQTLQKVEQGEDGCLLNAKLPSDIWSFAGDILLTVERKENGTRVEAATVIKGQLYDWGKSKRILAALFEDLKGLPV